MTTAKKAFVQGYIDKLISCFDQSEDQLFDLIMEIRNVFAKDLPQIEDAILLRHGTGQRDANSVIGILRLFLIDNDDGEIKTDPKVTPFYNISDSNINNKKIFISHASDDENIGEIFIEALIKMGIKIDDVFFSSQYRTGVKLGQDFSQIIRNALNDAEITIFMLTESFYKSEYCLNEMGAVWSSGQKFIPILLGGLSHEDMKGFIDKRYIAIKPTSKNYFKIFFELKKYSSKELSDEDVREIFKAFVKEANKMARTTAKEMRVLSETEMDIVNNRFTNGEILLLNYFIEQESRILNDGLFVDNAGEEVWLSDLKDLEKYAVTYEFDYNKAIKSLQYDGIISENVNRYVSNEISIQYILKQSVYRDLISLSESGKNKIKKIINERINNTKVGI